MKQRISGNPFAVSSDKKAKKYYLRGKSRTSWFEVDLFSDKKEGSKSSLAGLLLDEKKIKIWAAVLIAAVFILVVRLAYLQLIRNDYYRAIAEGNRIRIINLKAARGVIYDRHHNLLVENVPSFSLVVIPVDLPKNDSERQEVVLGLADISKRPAGEIFEILAKQSPYSYQPVVIQENLDHDQLIAAEILSGRFSGVAFITDSVRRYLNTETQPSLSHILGYQGKIHEDELEDYLAQGYLINDYVGKAGIELFYETELKGINGKEQVEVDATGEAKEVLASQQPIPGRNLVLTIDSDLQDFAEYSLFKTLQAYGKKRGAVIVMDPNSGEILALINWPAFDNNLFSRGISAEDFSNLINNPNQPLFSRSVNGEYPSGSTFKLIVGAAALQEGLITANFSFESVGGIAVTSWFFPDWKEGGHGWTNINKALEESVNTFFYIIGGGFEDFEGLGVARIMKYAEMFGLNKQLGIDLPNEATGFLPSKEWKEETKGENWYIGDTYHLAIGQGDILVTPLQVAAYTSVFANGGTLYRPYVVKEVLDSENNVAVQIKPKILNKNFIDPENIQIINRGLRQAVLSGSAKGLLGLPVLVAAKTGTAQWSSRYEPHAWITTFAPYDNPQIVVTVLVEEGEEGSRTALPVARDIINWWVSNR